MFKTLKTIHTDGVKKKKIIICLQRISQSISKVFWSGVENWNVTWKQWGERDAFAGAQVECIFSFAFCSTLDAKHAGIDRGGDGGREEQQVNSVFSLIALMQPTPSP